MVWEVEYTDEFETWWTGQLNHEERESVAAYVALLEERGPALRHPYSSGIKGSRYSHIRELRVQHKGHPYRVLYAFDPRRTAILRRRKQKGRRPMVRGERSDRREAVREALD